MGGVGAQWQAALLPTSLWSIWPQTQAGEVESEEQESKRALRDGETRGPELRFHQLQVSLFFYGWCSVQRARLGGVHRAHRQHQLREGVRLRLP